MKNPPVQALFGKKLFLSVLFLLGISLSTFAQTEAQPDSTDMGASRGAAPAAPLNTVLSTVNYAPGSISLDDLAKRELKRVARLMNMHQELRLMVYGHTDDTGDILRNQILSTYRAKLARAYLIGLGIAPDRLEYYGFGFRKPKVGDVSEEARAANRRVDIHFIVE
ncbi:MAG: OmpA family protein [Bacteroidota bacterium]